MIVQDRKTEDMSFGKMLMLVLKYLRWILIPIAILSLLALVITEFKIWEMVVKVHSVFFLGIVVAVSLHEWSHIYFMKKIGIKSIRIENSIVKFRVIPLDLVASGIRLIIIAIAGPISCLAVCLLIMLLNIFIFEHENQLLDVIAKLFFLQIMNLIPFFSDGKMCLKGFIDIKN